MGKEKNLHSSSSSGDGKEEMNLRAVLMVLRLIEYNTRWRGGQG